MEKLIAYFCAPTLVGIKPANIVTCYKNEYHNINSKIDCLNRQLNDGDIFFEPLRECERCVLLMVYRKKALWHFLSDVQVQKFLVSLGYPEKASIDIYISILKKRLTGDSFPHEIGAFLGYPMHDIYGFMLHRKCLLCGEWKVYENPEEAQELFDLFSICRKEAAEKILQGLTLSEIFHTQNRK